MTTQAASQINHASDCVLHMHGCPQKSNSNSIDPYLKVETPMPIEAVLFDLDGTLLDTLQDIADSMNMVLEENGMPTRNLDHYRTLIALGETAIISGAIPDTERNSVTVNKLVIQFRDEYAKWWLRTTKPYPGVADALDELVSRRIKLAILSNKPQEFATRYVAELLSRWTFEIVLGQQLGIELKPSSMGAQKVARDLNIAVARWLYLGDTGIDMRTAVGAGMCPVGVLWGFGTVEQLETNGARFLIREPIDTIKLVNLFQEDSTRFG